MKTKLAATKDFVVRHRTALAVGATATTALVLHIKVVGGFNEFLAEHNLLEEFYLVNEDIAA